MRFPGRRAKPAAVDVVDDQPATPVVGKGRPTPKRRESTPVRGPVSAPKTRKEAAQRMRQRSRTPRAAARPGKPLSSSEYRAAIRRGDEAYLPRRDQGPLRRLARDWADSRRMFSNYLLWLFPLMIAGFLTASSRIGAIVNLVVIAVFLGYLVEWYVTGRRILALARERGIDARTGAWSLGFYTGSRAYLPRRFRVPAPQVRIGDPI